MTSGLYGNRLRDILRYWSEVAPEAPFLTFCDLEGGTRNFTYGAFYEAVRRFAAGLQEVGVRPKDRCVIHLPNSVEFMIAFWAFQEVEAIAVPTIVQYAKGELSYVLHACEPACIVTDGEQLAKVLEARESRPNLPVISSGAPEAGEAWDFEELRTASPRAPLPPTAGGGDVALMLYTSGTTSRPKGVMLTHGSAMFTGETYAQMFRVRPDDRVLTCMPLFHVNALFLQLLPAMLSGSAYVLTPRFSLSRYWDWARDFGITVGHLVAGPIRLLASAEPSPRDRGHRLRLMTFGLPLAAEEISAFEERFGVPLTMAWGLTESSGAGTQMPLYFGRFPGYQAIGRAAHGWDVKIVDDNANELAPGAVGELLVRSPGVMSGYYSDEDATTETLRDGWLFTGDLAYKDDADYYHFVERKKDMIKTSGENVAASEVERVLGAHPKVNECAVVGVPDHILGEAVKAYIVLELGATVEPDELTAFCREHLSRFKVPSLIEVLPALPKTSIGKVEKRALREHHAVPR